MPQYNYHEIFSNKCNITILTIFWKWYDNRITIYCQMICRGLLTIVQCHKTLSIRLCLVLFESESPNLRQISMKFFFENIWMLESLRCTFIQERNHLHCVNLVWIESHCNTIDAESLEIGEVSLFRSMTSTNNTFQWDLQKSVIFSFELPDWAFQPYVTWVPGYACSPESL